MHTLSRLLACSTLALSLCLAPCAQAQVSVDISQDLLTHVDLPNAAGQYGQSVLMGRTVHGVLAGGFVFTTPGLQERSFLLFPPTTPGAQPTTRLFSAGPDCTWTQVQAVNRHPASVGWCYIHTPTRETVEGFYRSESGTITRLRFPGARLTEARAVNDQHLVVGWYEDQARVIHGFTWQRSTNQYTSFDTPFPAAYGILPVAVTNAGDIGVALLTTQGYQSAIRRAGQWTRLTTPGDEPVELRALGEDGRVLARITRPTGESALVLREGTTFSLLHWPIADVQVQALALSPPNLVLGYTVRDRVLPPDTPLTATDTIHQGFVATAEALRGEVLGPPPPQGLARAQMAVTALPEEPGSGCPDEAPLRRGRLGMSWIGCARLR